MRKALGGTAAITSSLLVTMILGALGGAFDASAATGSSFDQDAAGAVPAGWTCGVTGSGHPVWTVLADPSAPSPPHVLLQSGSGTFPWCVLVGSALADGFVEVRFKALHGSVDEAGGVIWRYTDGDDYYIARANALENNVSLYYMHHGERLTLKYTDAPVAPQRWHTLRVEFQGPRLKVLLDGTQYIDESDDHYLGKGAVGVWTKADSVTAFDDFSFGVR